ncbi:peptidoglycan recognition protein family protein [Dictyobacter arantiisoli]|uniref:N-acetylmuramoyl-L-alanine amidase n=1 Tax=Dictyobacter arantiisoli TaxID=2014874 RepID=A0A5A5TEA9_9CHLR|nr:peptidoglycan recognition family protein [Dictyobacter arantiisoli]GCF09578.1 hypothetical protein KDI_31420 [Dictyobacter arantiisoli]
MAANEPGAIWMPNGNAFLGRTGLQPRYVILHGTAGGVSAQNIATYFASTQGSDNPVSSHYVIGQDGTVVQCISESDGAWANGVLSTGHAAFWDPSINPNNLTISIEHCKPSLDNSDALTPQQQAASFKLIYDICQRWQIPLHNANASGGITGHFSIDPVNRSNCPGPYPWNALWAYLDAQGAQTVNIDLNTPGVEGFFVAASNGRWLCSPNGHYIGGAILSFYRRFGNGGLCGITYLGLPLTNEIAVSGHPGVVYQRFERGALAYDPKHVLDSPPGAGDVYCMHVDKGIGMFPAPKSVQTSAVTATDSTSIPIPVTAGTKFPAQVTAQPHANGQDASGTHDANVG